MNKKFINIIIPTIVLLLFAGCATSGRKVNVFREKAPSSTIVADNILSMPKDASQVILAITAKILNSDKEIRNVTFQSTSPVKLPYAKLFNFKKGVLLTYNKEAKDLTADLFFSDTLGRTCAYSVNASYSINDNKIIVQKYRVTEKFTPAENSVCFIFPANEYKKLTKDTLPKSFYDLYKYAATRAVTPQQALQYKDKMEWAVMVFVLDRMSKSADMELELSDKQGNSDKGYKLFSKYLIYNGWRVGVVMGKFHLLEPDSTTPLYAKIFCSPGGDFLSSRKMLGLYKLR